MFSKKIEQDLPIFLDGPDLDGQICYAEPALRTGLRDMDFGSSKFSEFFKLKSSFQICFFSEKIFKLKIYL